jgi:hypothetical protein
MRKHDPSNGQNGASPGVAAPPLQAGDKLTREEFLRRWEGHPEIQFAELIGGIVYMPSPQSMEHGDKEADVGLLLGTYALHTPGTKHSHNVTTLLGDDSPQPDVHLRILPEYGGTTRRAGKFLKGAAELIAEICATSVAYDLHQKLELYEAAGVQEYLAILMYEKEIRWHILTKTGYELLAPAAPNLWKSRVFPGLWLDGKAILADDAVQMIKTLMKGLRSPDHAAFVKKLAKKKKK